MTSCLKVLKQLTFQVVLCIMLKKSFFNVLLAFVLGYSSIWKIKHGQFQCSLKCSHSIFYGFSFINFVFILFINIYTSPCLCPGKRCFCLGQFPIYGAQHGIVTDIWCHNVRLTSEPWNEHKCGQVYKIVCEETHKNTLYQIHCHWSLKGLYLPSGAWELSLASADTKLINTQVSSLVCQVFNMFSPRNTKRKDGVWFVFMSHMTDTWH